LDRPSRNLETDSKKKGLNRMSSREIKIGTRGSPLALYQANWVKDRLAEVHPHLHVTLLKIKTTGDKIQDAPLAKIGGKGLFVKEIEEALIQKKIDLAVHSIKDVPTEFPEGLHLAAITQREDPRDVFISRDKTLLRDLRRGAKIGTSSLRRQAQLLYFRGDFEMIPLRGNLDTRIRKLKTMDLDGVVLALAGVKRLNLEQNITEILPAEISLPAIGQGALGIETRIGDRETEGYLEFLNDRESSAAVSAERAFLKKLEGGCQVPIGAYGRVEGGTLHIEGLVGRTDGKELIRHHLEGPADEAETLGTRLAEILLKRGAGEILAEVYRGTASNVQK
jgi:hydroxymethylbilane synthase